MGKTNDPDGNVGMSELSLEGERNPNVENEKISWSEVMIGNMVMSETDFGLTLDIQETSIKMSSEDLEETLEFIITSPEKVKILVNGSTQADIPSIQVLKEIGNKIEEKNIASEKIIKEMLRGKDENFFTKFTTLITLLKLTFLLRQKANETPSSQTARENDREKRRDSQIGPYF